MPGAMGINVEQLSTWTGPNPPTSAELRSLLQLPLGFIYTEPATQFGPAKEWIYVLYGQPVSVPIGTPLYNTSPLGSDISQWIGTYEPAASVTGVTQQEFPPYTAGFILRKGVGRALAVDSANDDNATNRAVLTTPEPGVNFIGNARPFQYVNVGDIPPNGAATPLDRGICGYVVFPSTNDPLTYAYLDCRGY
jgi:hypothetical protein